MHYHAELVFPPGPKPTDDEIDQAMGLHQITDENPDGLYDWFEVGARKRGCHVKGYDSNADPDHFGPDGQPLWPTEWKSQSHPKDICLVGEADPDLTADTIIFPDGTLKHTHVWGGEGFSQGYIPTDFDGIVLPYLKAKGVTNDAWLVTVDYHS